MKPLTHLVLAALTLACATRRSPPPAPPPSPPPQGHVSYRLVEDPHGRPEPDPGGPAQELVPPMVSPQNPAPGYPDEALAAGCPRTEVILRLIIDEQGNVSDVAPSPFQAGQPSSCARTFETAAKEATRTWRFAPAHKQTLVRPVGDGPRGQPQWTSEPIRWYADFAFTFEIVEGRGVVSTPQAR